MTDVDSVFMEQIFNIAQRTRKSNVHHLCELEDLERRFEIAEWIPGHKPKLEQGGVSSLSADIPNIRMLRK